MKKTIIGIRKIPIPKKGNPSTREIRNAIPKGELKRKKENPIDKMIKVKKTNRASTETKVPITLLASDSDFLACLRISTGK